ncbi:MAG: peptidylprolyl isomerase [Raoultibacter sp.]
MKASKLLRFVCAAGLASACVLGLAACSNNSDGMTGGTAATVNGVEISEDKVTTYIQNFRTASSLGEEEAWGKWLAENSYTPQSVREEVIDYYVSQELVKQAAAENNVTVESTEIDDTVNKMKANYDSDEAWAEALTKANTTEEAYRESVELALTEQALKEVVGKAEAPTDAELIEYSAMYNGAKRSSHILFNTEDQAKAQEVLDKINSGELEFTAAVTEYSQDTGTKEKGGDVGWDKLSSLVTEYTTGLKDLEKDQISGLVESTYGYHIIKCTDIFATPEGGITSLDQVPAEILESVRTSLTSQKETEAFNTWYTEYKESAEIVINDMPENVSYNIDMTNYPAPTDESATSGTESGSTGSTSGDAAAAGSGTTDGATAGSTDTGAQSGSTDSSASTGEQQPAEAS